MLGMGYPSHVMQLALGLPAGELQGEGEGAHGEQGAIYLARVTAHHAGVKKAVCGAMPAS